jgi:hypothetical protein
VGGCPRQAGQSRAGSAAEAEEEEVVKSGLGRERKATFLYKIHALGKKVL